MCGMAPDDLLVDQDMEVAESDVNDLDFVWI
jgi:hypothetical protein